MRLFLALVCIALEAACTTASSPFGPSPRASETPASFYEVLVACRKDATAVPPESLCRTDRDVTRKTTGGYSTLLGADYQFQLFVNHSSRDGCRVFGNIRADRGISVRVATFNVFERAGPFLSPPSLYLTGLRFKPAKRGSYFLYVQATDSCDVAPGAINPPYPVAVVVE